MGFDVMDVLGVSRQVLLLGVLGGLVLATVVAVVRNRQSRGAPVGLGLERERSTRR